MDMRNIETQRQKKGFTANGVERLSEIVNNPSVDFKVGDVVMYCNPYGIKFGPYTITAISRDNRLWPYGNCIYLDKDSYWCPVRPDSLTLINPNI